MKKNLQVFHRLSINWVFLILCSKKKKKKIIFFLHLVVVVRLCRCRMRERGKKLAHKWEKIPTFFYILFFSPSCAELNSSCVMSNLALELEKKTKKNWQHNFHAHASHFTKLAETPSFYTNFFFSFISGGEGKDAQFFFSQFNSLTSRRMTRKKIDSDMKKKLFDKSLKYQ